eukprot:8605692-Pyramimonas_sp.AAC.1
MWSASGVSSWLNSRSTSLASFSSKFENKHADSHSIPSAHCAGIARCAAIVLGLPFVGLGLADDP